VATNLDEDRAPEPYTAVNTMPVTPPFEQPATPPQQPVTPPPQLTPPQQPTQNGPPNPSNYPMLAGFWIDDFQNYMQVNVSYAGQVAGSVTSGPLTGYALNGQFTHTLLNYGVVNAYGSGAQSMGEWVDECHIQYLLLDGFGQPTGQTSMIHVNHYPDQPCS